MKQTDFTRFRICDETTTSFYRLFSNIFSLFPPYICFLPASFSQCFSELTAPPFSVLEKKVRRNREVERTVEIRELKELNNWSFKSHRNKADLVFFFVTSFNRSFKFIEVKMSESDCNLNKVLKWIKIKKEKGKIWRHYC